MTNSGDGTEEYDIILIGSGNARGVGALYRRIDQADLIAVSARLIAAPEIRNQNSVRSLVREPGRHLESTKALVLVISAGEP